MLLAEGATSKEMAERLGISERTISVHIDRIFLRLGVHDRDAALRAAIAAGFVDGQLSPETSAQGAGDPEPITNIRD